MMGYTRRQFVEAALEEIGLAVDVFDIPPERLTSAAKTLDALMATWNGKGIRIGYPIPSSPQDTVLDEETNVPDSAYLAVVNNLAVLLGPRFGKQVMQETKTAARSGYLVLLARAVRPNPSSLSGMPAGAGNKQLNSPFFPDSPEQVQVGPDGNLDLF